MAALTATTFSTALAVSPSSPERRSAVVATAALLRRGETSGTIAVSELLVADEYELEQKGAGWMLRYAGHLVGLRARDPVD